MLYSEWSCRCTCIYSNRRFMKTWKLLRHSSYIYTINEHTRWNWGKFIGRLEDWKWKQAELNQRLQRGNMQMRGTCVPNSIRPWIVAVDCEAAAGVSDWCTTAPLRVGWGAAASKESKTSWNRAGKRWGGGVSTEWWHTTFTNNRCCEGGHRNDAILTCSISRFQLVHVGFRNETRFNLVSKWKPASGYSQTGLR